MTDNAIEFGLEGYLAVQKLYTHRPSEH